MLETETLDSSLKEKIDLQVASRKRRIFAFMIDYILFFMLTAAIFFFMLPGLSNPEDTRTAGIVAFAMICTVLSLFIIKDVVKGTSPGKWVMGIAVRDQVNQSVAPSSGKLVARNLFLFILPVEFFVMLINKDKKRLGDNVLKTIVLANQVKSPRGIRITVLVVGFILTFGSIYVTAANGLKNSEPYKLSIQRIESDEKVLLQTGGITGYGFFINGSVKISNDIGLATFEISVNGKERDVTVQTQLSKPSDGDWQFELFEVVPDN